MTRLSLLLLLLVLLTSVSCDQTKTHSVSSTRNTFFISNNQLNFTDAKQYCENLNLRLAVLDTKDKSDAFNKLIKLRDGVMADSDNITKRYYWTGATERISDDTSSNNDTSREFIWSATNASLKDSCAFNNWCNFEPNFKTEHCLDVEFKGGSYCWCDVLCDRKMYLICESAY